MEADVLQTCSEKKSEVGVGKKTYRKFSMCGGDSLDDAECDNDSVLSVIHMKTNPSCISPIEIPYIIQLEIPPFAFFFFLCF